MIRVVIQQPTLAAYRKPLYEKLAQEPDIEIMVDYGSAKNLPNVDSGDFKKQNTTQHHWRIRSTPIYWHQAQIRYASRKRCDVLVLCSDIHYLSLLPALLRARLSGVRTLLWTHGYSKRSSGLRSWFRRAIYGLGSGLLLYGHAAAKSYLGAGWNPDRIFVAPNSLDQTAINEARTDWLSRPQDLETFQREHQLDQGPNLLYLGRLYADNNLMLLVEALPRLVEQFPKLQVILIGKGEQEQARLTESADALGVTKHLRFLGAIYGEQQIAPWALSCQAMVYPQNIGLSIMHAMGYGLPVVTSDDIASHNPEIEALVPDVTGKLYPHENKQALTETLIELLSDQTLRDRLGQAARNRVETDYNITIMAEHYANAIRAIARS